ncbi:hypothetical protein SDRG_02614 [Saprolegnia diclina VS20]|uniref:Uncharacterized protein n=1 Tax=Saprolegnia diclina (strain VS20) TaxID=1156394 RepID=T0S4M0_SAPDV|nr:hypothetical protein SDRG_02614 [Saprolegnia diclina VS20]EQC39958.1 hypothetical protein SDRG_02614 [Saprolegnia diclina VS20]|eukprot:XP_008606432.1 hypothetical protein SDRG_02614 [Saprolegnia diclina VS20]
MTQRKPSAVALVGNSGGGQVKWNAVKLGAASVLDHRVVLDSIRYDYDIADPQSYQVLKQNANRPCPYAQPFPKIISQRTSHGPALPSRPSPRLPTPLTSPPKKIQFDTLSITAPRSPTKPRSPQKPRSPPKPKPHAEATSPTSPRAKQAWSLPLAKDRPKYIPSIATMDRKHTRQFALAKMQVDGLASQLSKHEKTGKTLKSSLSDDDFNTACLTVARLAAEYAAIGDPETAWVYRCFGARALGDRYIQCFLKNVTLQFYDDAVVDLARACGHFQTLFEIKNQTSYARTEDETQSQSDRDRFVLLSLAPEHVVKSFAAHAANTALRQASVAIAEAKSRTGSVFHIRMACEMLSIAYAAFAWLRLETDQLGLVHTSIDAAQRNATLATALATLASNRHKALVTEWITHHQTCSVQAQSFLTISKTAEALRVPKDVTIATHIAATNLEKRVMAAVVQVLQGLGGNCVYRDHSTRIKAKRGQMNMGMAELRLRRKSALSGHVDNAYVSLHAAKRRSDLLAASYEADVYVLAKGPSATPFQPPSPRQQAELADMDDEGLASMAYEMNAERRQRATRRAVASYVRHVLEQSVRRVLRPLSAVATPVVPSAPPASAPLTFFDLDLDTQRQVILAEIQHCKTLYDGRIADEVGTVQKLCCLFHEPIQVQEASEAGAYALLQAPLYMPRTDAYDDDDGDADDYAIAWAATP